MALPIEQDEKIKKKLTTIMTILELVTWETTPQGNDYWEGVYNQLRIARDFKLVVSDEDEPQFDIQQFRPQAPAPRARRVTQEQLRQYERFRAQQGTGTAPAPAPLTWATIENAGNWVVNQPINGT